MWILEIMTASALRLATVGWARRKLRVLLPFFCWNHSRSRSCCFTVLVAIAVTLLYEFICEIVVMDFDIAPGKATAHLCLARAARLRYLPVVGCL